ncbi:hypothetical protein BCR44DRAFT_25915 [Catenaria anguillulae PL171]|uniref:Uncharacterized protein n=1 Tax=Catenaria anguillulae PL171 TaxID=765915 RepID=A0A1Y2HCB6_9FUNG|nr:hypothetical protein BCR44DRAFT_25915 [Catenaria anguillulae PL171]
MMATPAPATHPAANANGPPPTRVLPAAADQQQQYQQQQQQYQQQQQGSSSSSLNVPQANQTNGALSPRVVGQQGSRTPLTRANRSYPGSIAGTPSATPVSSPRGAATPSAAPSVAAVAAQSLPVVPGYEMAVLNEETFIPCPHAMPQGSEPAPLLKRKKSLFRRKSMRHQLQAEVQTQADPDLADEDMATLGRHAPEEVMGPQVDAILTFLNRELALKPASYSHALFSYALDGVAEAVEERRSVMWIAQPLIVTDEIEPMLDADPTFTDSDAAPPAPWTVDFESCLPSTFESTFEVSLEVPNTNMYRTCFYCEGRGTCKCTACSGNALILCKPCKSTGTAKNGAMCEGCQGLGCKTCEKCRNSGRHQCPLCQGHGALRVFLMLRAVWERHVSRLVDSNGYPLQPESPMGDLLAEVDAQFAATNVLALPQDMDATTTQEVTKFAEALRAHIAKDMQPAAWVRSFAYNIRVVPLFEMVYLRRKVFLQKKKARYLVYGNNVRGVLRMGSGAGPQVGVKGGR